MTDKDSSIPHDEPEAATHWLDRNREWLVVALFSVLMIFTRSWEGDLHGDPVRYAAVAKNILATGDWLTMHDGPDLVYANKPPLMFWLVAVGFRLFGVSTYTAKLWSCMFGVGMCLMTYLIGKRLFGGRAGMLAGCMIAVFPGAVPIVLDLRLESAVTFYTTVAVYCLVRVRDDGRSRWLLPIGVVAGLGAMTKPVAPVHIAVLTLLLLIAWRPRVLASFSLLAAVALAAAIAAPWHLHMVFSHGTGFTELYFGEQMGSRLSLGSHFFANLGGNISAMLIRSLPWWPLGAYAVARVRRMEPGERSGIWMALLWIAAVLVLMAIPPKRYDRYIIPAYPAIALAAGHGLNMLLSKRLRAAAPMIISRFAVVLTLLLATVPVPLHTYRCRGFAEVRSFLDGAMPGTSVASYDPRFPAGPSRAPKQWGLRAEVTYYLDRCLVNYAHPGQLAEAPPRFIISREDYFGALVDVGYEAVMPLDKRYWLLRRCPPGGAPASQPAEESPGGGTQRLREALVPE